MRQRRTPARRRRAPPCSMSILDALPRRAPNVAHALLGFDPALDPSRAVLAPFGEKFTCLTVLLELLEASPPGLCAGDLGAEPPEAASATSCSSWSRTSARAGGAGRPQLAPGRRRPRSSASRFSPPTLWRRLRPRTIDAAPPPRTTARWLLRVVRRRAGLLRAEVVSPTRLYRSRRWMKRRPPRAAARARAATRSPSKDPAAAFANADDHFAAPRVACGSPRGADGHHPRAAPRRSRPPPMELDVVPRGGRGQPPKARPPSARARRARRWRRGAS